MRKSRFSEGPIVNICKEHPAGLSATDLCCQHGIRVATFCKRAVAISEGIAFLAMARTAVGTEVKEVRMILRIGKIAFGAVCMFGVLAFPVNAETVRRSDLGVTVRVADTPKLLRFVEPQMPTGVSYPGEKAGSVQAEIFLRPDGWVASVRLVKASESSFWMVAESALKQWQYEPASLRGLPSPVRTSVTIEFPLPQPHNSGKVLAETTQYRVTASATQPAWCFQQPNHSQANVNIIWRVGPDEDLSGATAAYQRHLTDVWREVERHCTPMTAMYISNYVSGVRLVPQANREVAENERLEGKSREMPINSLMAWKDPATGKISTRAMADTPAYASLAAARKERRPPNIVALAVPPGTTSVPEAAPAATTATASAPAGAVSRSKAPAPQAPPASVLAPLDLQNLKHRGIIRDLYLGRFDLIPLADSRNLALLTDEGITGRKLFASYVEAFSDQCQQFLSARKVNIKRTITTKVQRVNGLGMVLSETETGSRTEDTGIYVEPEFAQAYVGISNSGGFEALVTMFRDMGARRSDSLAGAGLNLLKEILAMNVEMREVISRHGCDSAQVKRFARNALAYVTLQPAPQIFDGFGYHCPAVLPTYLPKATKPDCGCVKRVLRQGLGAASYYKLEDDFTEQRFFSSVVAKVGLHKEVAACLQ